jgi:nitrous oxidase accessory protein NosD/nitrous oxide reductase accessory protein NosL
VQKVTSAIRFLSRRSAATYAFVGAVIILAGMGTLAFAVDTTETTPDPVPFEETTDTGLSGQERFTLEEEGYAIPRVEVFYSQFPYVVGFRGVEYAIDAFQQPGHSQQFGYPTQVYVTDYAGRDLSLSEEGYLQASGEGEWTDAEDAHFVVESEAKTPASDVAIPFSAKSDATAFTEKHGGTVLDWSALQDHTFDINDATIVRDRVDDQRAAADKRVQAARTLTDREDEIVVGEAAETIQATIDGAEPGSTVLVPEGTYEEQILIDKPITLEGSNASIVGDGNGSVIRVEADDVAITGFTISGIGTVATPPKEEINESGWDATIASGYGHGDAGIKAVDTNRTYVADVSIDTPTSGILMRDVGDGIVERVTVNGTESWAEGFMGVLSVRSRMVIQQSTLDGGRDGIYLHRAHGTVIRNNSFRGSRFGVHFMYTSESLVADGVHRNHQTAGIVIMTDPERNAVVGNDIRHSPNGIVPIGARNYIAENVVAFNEMGLRTSTSTSLYERNVVFGNEVGMKTAVLRPSNRVVRNDIVANDEGVEAGIGPLRIWSRDGVGNYWEGASVRPNPGAPYSPTDPLDSQLHTVEGAMTLSESPAAQMLDAVRDTTPGMRAGNVVDNAPRREPVRPAVIARLEAETDE